MSMRMKRFKLHLKNTQRAFTLLEVLVALAVLVLGLGAVLKVSASSAAQPGILKDKTIALWVASNKANEIQLGDWPDTGNSNGYVMMAGHEWHWKMKVSNTADKDLRRMDIKIHHAYDEDEPLVQFIAFTGKRDNVK